MAEKRLIDANSILDDFLKRYTEMEKDGKLVFAACEIKQDFADMISNATTVDAVEVVRCRDCKRCFKHTTKRNRQKMWICMRNEVDVCVSPDDFCSYGERKDSNGNG